MPALTRPVIDERDALVAFLEQQRFMLRTTTFGLSDEQAASTPSASALCLGGLVKHCTAMERTWMDTTLQRRRNGDRDAYERGFRMEPGETLAGLLADYEAAARDTDAIIATLDLDTPVPVPKGVPWFPPDVEAWSVRWVLLHIIQETARHAGHADIIRESLDGATSFALLAAAESQAPGKDRATS